MMIENAFRRSVEGERSEDKVMKEHKNKYEKYWEKSHAAKLSKIKKYDLSEFRYKDLGRNPQNILVFNGKMMEFIQKLNN